MTKFKVGDKVRLMIDIPPHKIGDRGVLTERLALSSWKLRIRMESGDEFPIDPEEIEPMRAAAQPEASDAVAHPSHYNQHKVEVIDLIEDMPFSRGSIVKYVVRAAHKGQEVQDLKKAAWLLQREIERVEAEGD
jgi:hypothetical protein